MSRVKAALAAVVLLVTLAVSFWNPYVCLFAIVGLWFGGIMGAWPALSSLTRRYLLAGTIGLLLPSSWLILVGIFAVTPGSGYFRQFALQIALTLTTLGLIVITLALAVSVGLRRMPLVIVLVALPAALATWSLSRGGSLKARGVRLLLLFERQDTSVDRPLPKMFLKGHLAITDVDDEVLATENATVPIDEIRRWDDIAGAGTIERDLHRYDNGSEARWRVTTLRDGSMMLSSTRRTYLYDSFNGLEFWPRYCCLGVEPSGAFRYAEFPLNSVRTRILPHNSSSFVLEAPRNLIITTYPTFTDFKNGGGLGEHFVVPVGFPRHDYSLSHILNALEDPSIIRVLTVRPRFRTSFTIWIARAAARSYVKWLVLVVAFLCAVVLSSRFLARRRNSASA